MIFCKTFIWFKKKHLKEIAKKEKRKNKVYKIMWKPEEKDEEVKKLMTSKERGRGRLCT